MRPALLGKVSSAALSVCTYDPRSETFYALAEQAAADKAVSDSTGASQIEEEKKQGAPSTTKARPGIL